MNTLGASRIYLGFLQRLFECLDNVWRQNMFHLICWTIHVIQFNVGSMHEVVFPEPVRFQNEFRVSKALLRQRHLSAIQIKPATSREPFRRP